MIMRAREVESIVHLTDDEVTQILHRSDFVERMRAGLSQDFINPLRQRVDAEGRSELLIMPALSRRYISLKTLTITPDNADDGLPVIRGLCALFDRVNGRALATMDAEVLTKYRTAAVSAIAVDALAARSANRLLLVGTGALVPYLAWAIAQSRQLSKILVWGRDLEKARAACERIREMLPALVCEPIVDLRVAVAVSDIISLATRSTEPLVQGKWVRPGSHVDLVGSYRPDMREADDQLIASGSVYVDTIGGCLAEAGDLIHAIAEGQFSADEIKGDLRCLLHDFKRSSPDEITVFKAVGSAAADLACAELVWNRWCDPKRSR